MRIREEKQRKNRKRQISNRNPKTTKNNRKTKQVGTVNGKQNQKELGNQANVEKQENKT